MTEGQQVQRAHVLKQFNVSTKDIKKGDIFRLSVVGENGQETQTDWHVAMTDAVIDEKTGALSLQADVIHMVMGRPEIVNFALRRGELSKASLAPQAVPQRQGATPG